MKYCEKCRKTIHPKEETYRGLCIDCYREYLYEKIEEIGKKKPEPEKKENIWDRIKEFFRK